jgi:hypothetical protein
MVNVTSALASVHVMLISGVTTVDGRSALELHLRAVLQSKPSLLDGQPRLATTVANV